MRKLYIGLMSGTSADGIDATLVDLSDKQPRLLTSHYAKFDSTLREAILSFSQPRENEINSLAELDVRLGKAFAHAANELLKKSNTHYSEIQAIGSHGQTLRHCPSREFTLQIADPNIIASKTNITTVADFRRADIAHGGQGAPLVPAFHHAVFSTDTCPRVIINIGGIANITFLPHHQTQPIIGFDTGPGNTLLDAWIQTHHQKSYDHHGNWAKAGSVHQSLLTDLLQDTYFSLPSPKSTGSDYFNLSWLASHLSESISPVDVQATLLELTARSIIDGIPAFKNGEIFICGGGVHNHYLMNRLSQLAHPAPVYSTQSVGIDPNLIESMAFAWLAKQTLERKPGNITTVTGAKQAVILGAIYYI